MKRKVWALGIGMALACSQAFAWMAMASDNNSNTSIAFDADTPEEATRGAMKMCEAESNHCTVKDAVNATAMVIAKGKGGWGSAADPSPEKAQALALANCRKVASNCKVTQAVWDSGVFWAAVTVGEGATSVQVNGLSKEEAEAAALAGCRKASTNPDTCAVKPTMTSNRRLHYARASSATQVGIGRAADDARARSLALESCGERMPAGERCNVERVALNDTGASAPKQMARLEKLAERNANPSSAPRAGAPRNPVLGLNDAPTVVIQPPLATPPQRRCETVTTDEQLQIYENVCDYNQYGPTNCRNVPTFKVPVPTSKQVCR